MTQTPLAASSDPTPMIARVGAKFAYATTSVDAALMSFAVSDAHVVLDETILVHAAGEQVEPVELRGDHGTRLHLVEGVGTGWLEVTYEATVDITRPTDAPTGLGVELDRWLYTRPSRYAESDRLGAVAARSFTGVRGRDLVDAVAAYVYDNYAYVSGSSRGTDGAVDTLLAGRGVCRDFAHVVVALLRARGVPARLVSVYAPGLEPMDFHAVAEAWVEGAWHVVDATRLAPRQSLVRIATGRDAADTAFLTTSNGTMRFNRQEVTAALVEGDLPTDDHTKGVRLA